jgi:hypothetical protein
MYLIKCLNDIYYLREIKALSIAMLDQLESDLRVIHKWNDEDQEYSFEDFHTDVLQCGCIVIFKTIEDIDMMEELGVSGGVKALIPETTKWHQFAKEQWLRIDVVYNESFAMIFYIAGEVSKRVSALSRGEC